jgi:hypothetical protein
MHFIVFYVTFSLQIVVLDAISKQRIQSLVLKDDARQADVLDLRTGTSYMAAIQVHVGVNIVPNEYPHKLLPVPTLIC